MGGTEKEWSERQVKTSGQGAEQCPKIQEQRYEKAEVTNVPCCRRPVMACQGPFQWHHGVRAGF